MAPRRWDRSWVPEGCVSQPETETNKSRCLQWAELKTLPSRRSDEWEFLIWVASKSGCGHEGNLKVEGTLGEATCSGHFRELAAVGWKGSLLGGVANIRTQWDPISKTTTMKSTETLQYQSVHESLNPASHPLHPPPPSHTQKHRGAGKHVFVQGTVLYINRLSRTSGLKHSKSYRISSNGGVSQ